MAHHLEHFFKGVCICGCENCMLHPSARMSKCICKDCPPNKCGMKTAKEIR